jgi:2-dehydro-3-deoxyglucarate aldolase/4-hydroxy-2-oxoheptanedioate aldolase
MRENLFQKALAEGRMPRGHMVWEFSTRGIPRILDSLNLDFVVFDMEHSNFEIGDIADLMAWTHGCRFTPFVRLPQDHYHFVARVLDAGALGVMIANVKTAEQAAAVVNCAKYPPRGIRGLGLGTAHNSYVMPNPKEYLDAANRSTTVICQIEHPDGVANAESIAAVDGVDVLWVGHFDLTANMGIVGEFAHPHFHAALDRVIAAAQKHGKASAIQPGAREQFREWKAKGFDVLSYGADFGMYKAGLAAALETW